MSAVAAMQDWTKLFPEVEELIPADAIQNRIRELGQQIEQDYAGLDTVFIGVLKGSMLFMSDLFRAVHAPITCDFVAISSYAGSQESSGVVRLLKDLDAQCIGRHLLIVEDIVDTGLTLRYLLDLLMAREPASLRVCSLLDKPERRKVDVPVHYKGFSIPNRFVVGYGLDHEEKYRNLPFIGVLKIDPPILR